jgi:hypothetical protein
MSPRIFRVHSVYEIDEIPWSGPGEGFRFRLEVLQSVESTSSFFTRVYRREHYRIQPTFPQSSGEPSLPPYDKVIVVEDDYLLDWESSRSASAAESLRKVLAKIEEVFGTEFSLDLNSFGIT